MSSLDISTTLPEAELEIATEYITITRAEYDELVTKAGRLKILMAAIDADVLPSTIRRIVKAESSYKLGRIVGNVIRNIIHGISDAGRIDRTTAEAAEAAEHYRASAEEDA